jgi:hypothetical protein
LELLKLTSSQRLFVQRWIELFDWTADIHFQFRPVSLAEAEAELLIAEGFHEPLLVAEVDELRQAPLFSTALIDINPTLAAERLAANQAAKLHHPLYLFHAINILLDTGPSSFEERLERLEDAWRVATETDYVVYFRVTKLRALPSKRDESPVRLTSTAGLPDPVKLTIADWKEKPELGILRVVTRTRDPKGALESATRKYYDYRATVRAASPSLKPSEIDLSTAIVQNLSGPDPPRLMAIQHRRFQMRGGKDFTLFERLERAVSTSVLVATFVRNLAEAIEKLREGDVDSSLEALILNQDLAFQGCRIHTWRYPRYLVEIGSKLIALDWPRRYFEYLKTYLRQPSHTVVPLDHIRHDKLSRTLLLAQDAWLHITDRKRWARMISRTSWDCLLAHRREAFLLSVSNLPTTVNRVQTVAAWDLARAVRARNTLIHEGLYLQHHRLIGVLLDTYELVLQLRLMACERSPHDPETGFNQLVNDIERDFEDATNGIAMRQTARSLCEDGWSGMWNLPQPAPTAT